MPALLQRPVKPFTVLIICLVSFFAAAHGLPAVTTETSLFGQTSVGTLDGWEASYVALVALCSADSSWGHVLLLIGWLPNLLFVLGLLALITGWNSGRRRT